MSDKKQDNRMLLRYAGLSSQLVIGILVALFTGKKTDSYLNIRTPMFIWIFPLLLIIGVIIKIVLDTGKKK